MIPPADIAAWQHASPLDLDDDQAEREMVLRRLLIEIGNDDLLAESVVCSGGTTLQHTRAATAARHSYQRRKRSQRSRPSGIKGLDPASSFDRRHGQLLRPETGRLRGLARWLPCRASAMTQLQDRTGQDLLVDPW